MAFDGGLQTSDWSLRPTAPTDAELKLQAAFPTPPSSTSAREIAPTESEIRRERPPVSPPRRPAIHIDLESRLTVLQTWEGFVEEIDEEEGTFRGRLMDLSADDTDEEFAVFSIDDVDPDDRELLVIGGVFRWIIGYRDMRHGRRARESSIVFRRLPAYSIADIEAAKARGERRANAFRAI